MSEEYEIVTATSKDCLQKIVNLKIKLGYKPVGGVLLESNPRYRVDKEFSQALVKQRTPPTEGLESSLSSACYVAMPKELTAENGAKGLMTGEFYETIEVENEFFCGCGTCDFCIECPGEPESTLQKIPISWVNIKEIYAMAVKHFDAVHTPTKEPQQ
ncbi:hypothetical protein N9913_02820 [Porticoccaceae bacterium]|nr:hypothetical protein [Porticoccaceae bacterium]